MADRGRKRKERLTDRQMDRKRMREEGRNKIDILYQGATTIY